MAGRARAAKRAEKIETAQDWGKWIPCELCGKPFCCNNYADRKPRVKRFMGKICCAYCQHNALPVIRLLVAEGKLKVKKPKKKKGSSGHEV